MTDVRLFTLQEADATLPLVQRIVADLLAEYDGWRAAMARYEVEAAGIRAEWGEPPDLVNMRTDVTDRAERINALLAELESIGCLFKGFEAGVVDFYSLRDDQLVFLCWSLGEERITHWHPIDAGFAGRQPIDESLLTGHRA